MKRLLILLPLLASTPAMADWQLKHETTKKTWSYAAFDSDKSGALELQFYCDYKYPGEVQLLVFTGDDWTGGPDEQNPVEMTVQVGDKTFPALAGHDDEVNAERVVYADTLDDKGLFDVIDAASSASGFITVSYEGTSHRFPTSGLGATLGELVTGCKG